MKSSKNRKSCICWIKGCIPRDSGGWKTSFIRLLQTDLSAQKTQHATFPDEQQRLEFDTFLSLQHLGIGAETAAKLAFAPETASQVMHGLKKGKPFPTVLGSLPGWNMLGAFLEVMDLQTATEAIYTLGDIRGFNDRKTVMQIVYPFTILAGVFAMLIFFDGSVLPMMSDFLEGDLLPLWMKTVRTGYFMLLCLLTAAGLVLWTGMQGQMLHSAFLESAFVRQRHSLYLAACIRSLLEQELSTAALLTALEKLPGPKVFVQQVKAMKSTALQGGSWVQILASVPWIDPDLVRHAETGVETGKVCSLLKIYENRTKRLQTEKVRQVVRTLTGISYGSVGVLAVIVYQVLLAPMNMLSAM